MTTDINPISLACTNVAISAKEKLFVLGWLRKNAKVYLPAKDNAEQPSGLEKGFTPECESFSVKTNHFHFYLNVAEDSLPL